MTGLHAERNNGRRFHLVERIGDGAFGEVYLADMETETGFRKRIAIKLLRDEVKVPGAGQRMRDEARILGRLSHRNIVAVLDLVRLGERTAILMEHIPGSDLEQVVAALGHCRERFPVRAALEAGAAIAWALDSAWTARDADGAALQVVHRDIKPSNIRLAPDGVIKVLDFGVATFTSPSREALTITSAWIGTERYMAPERILCEGDGPGGDVYALAATVLELINGRPLGRSPVLAERHVPFVDASLASLRSRAEVEEPAIAEALENALRGGLAVTAAERPEARLLAATLQSLADAASGESLASFAARFVPLVPALTRREVFPASGVLVESDGLEAAAESLAEPARERPRSSVAPLAMVGAAAGTGVLGVLVGGVLLVGGGIYLGLSLRPASSPDPGPSSAVEGTVPAPVPAPAYEVPTGAALESAPPPGPVPGPVPMPEPAPGPGPSSLAFEGSAGVPPVPSPMPTAVPAGLVAPPSTAPSVLAPPGGSETSPLPPSPPPSPVATVATAAPVSSAPSAPSLDGLWTGKAGGRPFELRLTDVGGRVTAQAVFVLGANTSVVSLVGVFDGDTLTLSSSEGARFEGELVAAGLEGTYALDDGRRLSWSVSR